MLIFASDTSDEIYHFRKVTLSQKDNVTNTFLISVSWVRAYIFLLSKKNLTFKISQWWLHQSFLNILIVAQLFKGCLPSQFVKLNPCEFDGVIFDMSRNFVSMRPSGSAILVPVELVPSGFFTVQTYCNSGKPRCTTNIVPKPMTF